MTEQPPSLAHSTSSALEILGEFAVGQQVYWIVKADKKADKANSSSASAAELHFALGDHNLAIVPAHQRTGASNQALGRLTAREVQIATLVALGLPNKLVADKLHISEWTVATYLRRIYSKLGVDNRAAMSFRCASLIEKCGTTALADLA